MVFWSHDETNRLVLLTPDEFEGLPEGAILESIQGDLVIKGVSEIDMDVRRGHIAFGIREEWNQPVPGMQYFQKYLAKWKAAF